MIVFARNLVAKDFWLKLFSLALAILIWLTVRFISGEATASPWLALLGRAPNENVITVPVHILAKNGQSFSANPAEVQVTLRGDQKIIKNLRKQDVRAEVDATAIELANGMIKPVEIILPQGIAYTHLAPEEVEMIGSAKP
jgi:YbbR domain-containing protein